MVAVDAGRLNRDATERRLPAHQVIASFRALGEQQRALDSWALERIAECALELKDPVTVVEAATCCLQLHPDDPRAPRMLWLAASAQRMVGREELATRTLGQLRVRYPGTTEAARASALLGHEPQPIPPPAALPTAPPSVLPSSPPLVSRGRLGGSGWLALLLFAGAAALLLYFVGQFLEHASDDATKAHECRLLLDHIGEIEPVIPSANLEARRAQLLALRQHCQERLEALAALSLEHDAVITLRELWLETFRRLVDDCDLHLNATDACDPECEARLARAQAEVFRVAEQTDRQHRDTCGIHE